MQSYAFIYEEGVIVLLNQDAMQKYYIYPISGTGSAVHYKPLWNSLRYVGSR